MASANAISTASLLRSFSSQVSPPASVLRCFFHNYGLLSLFLFLWVSELLLLGWIGGSCCFLNSASQDNLSLVFSSRFRVYYSVLHNLVSWILFVLPQAGEGEEGQEWAGAAASGAGGRQGHRLRPEIPGGAPGRRREARQRRWRHPRPTRWCILLTSLHFPYLLSLFFGERKFLG